MNSEEEKQPETSQQPAYRNPAEPYLQQSATPQAAYCPSIYSAPQNAPSEVLSRSLLRGAGNSASLIPIVVVIIENVLAFVLIIAWFIANIGKFLPYIKKPGGSAAISKYLTSQPSTIMLLSIFSVIPAMIITILIARSMLHCKIKEQYKRPSLTFPEFIKYLVVAFGIAGVGEFLGMGILGLSSRTGIKVTMPDFSLSGNSAQNVILLIYVCLLGPVLEETLFRGLILQSLRPWGDKLAIIVSGVLFGLMHMNLLQGIPAALLGMFFAFVAVKTGSIVPTVLLHILYNSTTMILALCGLETNEALTTGYYIFLGVMIAVSIILILIHRIPFRSISKEAAPNIQEPEHPYRVVFLQSAAFWVMVALFVVSSFLPAIMPSFSHM